jgi:hypothetical protein
MPFEAVSQDGISTVRDLLNSCETTLSLSEQLADDAAGFIEVGRKVGECTGMVRGIAQMLSYACWSREEGYLPMFASGTPTSLEASIQAFVNWARATPGAWGEAAEDGLMLATMETWTCE